MAINVHVKDRILKPVSEVFDAIVSPDKITGYFASHTSDRMESGKNIAWKFEDVGAELNVQVSNVILNKLVAFEWSASGKPTTVEIKLTSENENICSIIIKEQSFDLNEEDTRRALQQTQGWTDFVCSLKAYLYTGINLRNGRRRDSK